MPQNFLILRCCLSHLKDLKDDFSERPEFRQLKEELRTGIRSWIDENGVPGYHSPARKEKPPAPYSEQPRYSKRNKRK